MTKFLIQVKNKFIKANKVSDYNEEHSRYLNACDRLLYNNFLKTFDISSTSLVDLNGATNFENYSSARLFVDEILNELYDNYRYSKMNNLEYIEDKNKYNLYKSAKIIVTEETE